MFQSYVMRNMRSSPIVCGDVSTPRGIRQSPIGCESFVQPQKCQGDARKNSLQEILATHVSKKILRHSTTILKLYHCVHIMKNMKHNWISIIIYIYNYTYIIIYVIIYLCNYIYYTRYTYIHIYIHWVCVYIYIVCI